MSRRRYGLFGVEVLSHWQYQQILETLASQRNLSADRRVASSNPGKLEASSTEGDIGGCQDGPAVFRGDVLEMPPSTCRNALSLM
jgi:hypothetical protein